MFAAPDSKLTKSFDDLVGLYTNRQHDNAPLSEVSGNGFFGSIKKFFGF